MVPRHSAIHAIAIFAWFAAGDTTYQFPASSTVHQKSQTPSEMLRERQVSSHRVPTYQVATSTLTNHAAYGKKTPVRRPIPSDFLSSGHEYLHNATKRLALDQESLHRPISDEGLLSESYSPVRKGSHKDPHKLRNRSYPTFYTPPVGEVKMPPGQEDEVPKYEDSVNSERPAGDKYGMLSPYPRPLIPPLYPPPKIPQAKIQIGEGAQKVKSVVPTTKRAVTMPQTKDKKKSELSRKTPLLVVPFLLLMAVSAIVIPYYALLNGSFLRRRSADLSYGDILMDTLINAIVQYEHKATNTFTQ